MLIIVLPVQQVTGCAISVSPLVHMREPIRDVGCPAMTCQRERSDHSHANLMLQGRR